MIDFKVQNKVSPEVYHSEGTQINLDRSAIETLKNLAKKNPRQRIRFCSHQTSEELTHEMFIVHPKNAYVRPHKHLNKIESMMVLQGEVDYISFDEQGKIRDKILMGDFVSGKVFYNSIRTDIFHTLIIRSEWLVFLEITKGPFRKEDSAFADWSPCDDDITAVEAFLLKFNNNT
jgi:cupin fold WbuC family metalloprotein